MVPASGQNISGKEFIASGLLAENVACLACAGRKTIDER
jgi:hypothetical protein